MGILFESDANKRLYRLIFVWGWFAHTLGQITHNFGPYLENVGVSSGFVWEAYWKFMPSDEAYLSPSVLTFWFGRWMWSWNCPNEHQWRSESYSTILFLLFAKIFLRDD